MQAQRNHSKGKKIRLVYQDTQEEEGWDWVAVRSIEQFVEYLVAKDPKRVRTAQLTSVPGRNTIVYYCPDECAMREESGGRKRAAGEQ